MEFITRLGREGCEQVCRLEVGVEHGGLVHMLIVIAVEREVDIFASLGLEVHTTEGTRFNGVVSDNHILTRMSEYSLLSFSAISV